MKKEMNNMAKQNIYKIIISGGFGLIFIIGLYYRQAFIPREVYFKWQNSSISVYDNVSLKDCLLQTNTEIINQKLSTEKLGKHVVKFAFKYHNQKYQSTFTYSVVDKENPQIFGGSSKSVPLNYEKNLCDLIMYADNYDRNLKCSIEGDYDLSQIGSYKIKFIVQDASLNAANHNITLNVYDPLEKNDPEEKLEVKTLPFLEAIEQYQTSDLEIGIDVSKWQGDIDFTKVKNAGASFIMLRIGHKNKIGDDIELDPYFYQNIERAQEAGLKTGIYLYSKAASKKDAIAEANWVLKNLKDEKLTLPIVFDWENWSSWNTFHLNFHDLNELAHAFISTVEKAGYKGMLYGSKFYLENFFKEKYDYIWLAHYTTKTSYENYAMWQFSNIGRIDGINGAVDLDVMKKNNF